MANVTELGKTGWQRWREKRRTESRSQSQSLGPTMKIGYEP